MKVGVNILKVFNLWSEYNGDQTDFVFVLRILMEGNEENSFSKRKAKLLLTVKVWRMQRLKSKFCLSN